MYENPEDWTHSPSEDELRAALEADNGAGFCLSCGAEHDNCELDAREYECDACGNRSVFGAAECLFMGAYIEEKPI